MLINDIRFAVRALARSRTFTITALTTLALGISVNTAIFSVIDSVLLRQPPFDQPDRIVTVDGENKQKGMTTTSLAYPDVVDWREGSRAFSEIAVIRSATFNMASTGDPERATGARVSTNFFRVFGVQPQLGRVFLPEEELAGREQVVVLTDGFWRRKFGAERSIIGRQVALNG